MRTLVAVARHRTFAAAGHRIGLTQAAVSGHIRRLEDTLGFPLFERTGRSAVLNEAGWRTVKRAEEILQSVDALAAPEAEETAPGMMRIGAINSAQPTILARALVPFRQRFPRCRIHVAPDLSLHLMDRIETGLLDLAIITRPTFDLPRDLQWTTLVREPYALVVPAGIEGDDWRVLIEEHAFIRYDRGSFAGRHLDRFLRESSVKLREGLEVDDLAGMVAMAANGLGVALVPLSEALLPLPETVRALPVTPEPIYRDIGLVRRAGENWSPAMDLSAELIAAA
ncbi:LysR family transcriptional regulator [Acuticoccus sp. M5D2P5]|uniref:LysR family transcriptional regulator n=1 Tax=Acuticoccus kalidii TaxID=2910977 RepID=UPI001F2BDE4F|nr:LysR family transcriptional regulator [Acuticoccus kalidii]MCF3935151.1 LysR family transcriptional regulator [Acuticoccus kalidii]